MPIPIFPLCFTTNNDVPEEEATLKGSNAPAVPCMLKLIEEEVALILATEPLSINVLFVTVFVPDHLVIYPFVPVPWA